MSNIIDRANDRAQQELDRIIEAARGVVPGKGKRVEDSLDLCLGCGLEIPSERQIAIPGVELCVSCQEEMEARR